MKYQESNHLPFGSNSSGARMSLLIHLHASACVVLTVSYFAMPVCCIMDDLTSFPRFPASFLSQAREISHSKPIAWGSEVLRVYFGAGRAVYLRYVMTMTPSFKFTHTDVPVHCMSDPPVPLHCYAQASSQASGKPRPYVSRAAEHDNLPKGVYPICYVLGWR